MKEPQVGQEFKHIAIVGKAHSGKTSLARLLVEDHGFTRIGLADPIKWDVVEILNYGITYDRLPPFRMLKAQEVEKNKSVFRPFLQWYGTEFWREYMGEPDHWIEEFLKAVEDEDGPVVCDDVRFVNEAEALWDAGFMVVKIVRPHFERVKSVGPWMGQAHDHPSETEQDGIMPYLTVPNDKGLDELRGHAETLAEMIEDGGAWALRV